MIPFVREMHFTYGRAERVSPLIRRLVARNPGPFTFTGTGTYIVGHGTVAIIDPGPDQDGHLQALLAATRGETVSHIFVTHSHLDHSPLAQPLAAVTGAVIYAGGAPCTPSHGADRLEAGDDLAFRPDVALDDGRLFRGPDWTIEAVATPGHTANHYAFGLVEENALFPGDCVMGWSTSVVSPPDGDMADYLASLEKIRGRDYETLWPAHGPPVRDVGAFMEAYIDHRRRRESALLDALASSGPTSVRRLIPTLYPELDRRLHPAAAHSTLAHLVQLVREGRVECFGLPTMGAVYRLARLQRAA